MPSLKKILSKHFVKHSLIPIFVIEVALLVLYFSVNYYITHKSIAHLQEDALDYGTEVTRNESAKINQVLEEISRFAKIMQSDHQHILSEPERYNILDIPEYRVASNGVYFKTTKAGASLYYSSHTPIGDKEKSKAILSEAMDPLLEEIVEANKNIVAAYFNSFDNMNRLYPYIDKVYTQYGEHIHMEDYNFYYLAKAQNNPSRGPVWTEAYLDPAGNGWMLSCIVPIYTGNFLQGVSGLDITIEKLLTNILDVELPYDGRMFILNAEGMLIAFPPALEKMLGLLELKNHTYKDPITQTITKPEEFNIFKNKSPFAMELQNVFQNSKITHEISVENKGYILMHHVVNETKWQLMVMIDKEKVFASVNTQKKLSNTIGYAAIIFLALFYVVFFSYLVKKSNKVAASITDPIEILTEQTSQIGQGKLQIKTIDTNIDELYQLSSNFYNMVLELNSRTTQLIEVELQKRDKEKEAIKYMDKSMKDPLTHLYNRNKGDQLMENLMTKFEKHDMKFSVIFLDIDNFKAINDIFGHSAGDAVLKDVAKILQANTRQRDSICRWGGDEFVVLCSTYGEATLEIAKNLRLSISSHSFPVDKVVTSSFGVTEVLTGDDQGIILARADKALYLAKSLGRNRVELAKV